MRRPGIAFVAACMLASCGFDLSDDPTSDHGTYDINPATGETTVAITTEDGTLQVNSGANVAADLPDGWALYPGAEVLTTTNASMAGGKSAIVNFESEDSPEQIIAFYRDAAEENQVMIEMEVKTAQGWMIAGSSQDGANLSVISSAQDEKTVTNLAVRENFGS